MQCNSQKRIADKAQDNNNIAKLLPPHFQISSYSFAMSASNVSLPTHFSTSNVAETRNNGYDTTTSYEQSRRQVSSVVVSEQFIGDLPESGGVRYVEIPVVEEVIRHVARREVVEVEKIVPKYEYDFVERVVEVPQIQYVDRQIEKLQVQEVIRHVPIKQVQEVPREVVKTVPKIEYVNVEKIVQVPGPVVEVPKPYTVENKISVKKFNDKNTPVVVAQTIRPVVVESNEVIDIDVYEYEPQVIPVDVHVAKPVASHLVAVGATQEVHQVVTVPAAQYNTILRSINRHLGADVDSLPYIHEGNRVPFLGNHETPGTSAPAAHVNVSNLGIAPVMTTTSSSMYPSGYYNRGQTTTEQHMDNTASSQMAVPPVYPGMMTRDTLESTSPSVGKAQSHIKSNRSLRSFAPSQPAQRKRNMCQC